MNQRGVLRHGDVLGEGTRSVVHDVAEHLVAGPQRLHGIPDLHDPPGDVGTEDGLPAPHPRIERLADEVLPVRPIHGRRDDLDEHVVVAGNRCLHFPHLEDIGRAVPIARNRFHAVMLAAGRRSRNAASQPAGVSLQHRSGGLVYLDDLRADPIATSHDDGADVLAAFDDLSMDHTCRDHDEVCPREAVPDSDRVAVLDTQASRDHVEHGRVRAVVMPPGLHPRGDRRDPRPEFRLIDRVPPHDRRRTVFLRKLRPRDDANPVPTDMNAPLCGCGTTTVPPYRPSAPSGTASSHLIACGVIRVMEIKPRGRRCLRAVVLVAAIAMTLSSCGGSESAFEERRPDVVGWVLEYRYGNEYRPTDDLAIHSAVVEFVMEDGRTLRVDGETDLPAGMCRIQNPLWPPCWIHAGLTDDGVTAEWVTAFRIREEAYDITDGMHEILAAMVVRAPSSGVAYELPWRESSSRGRHGAPLQPRGQVIPVDAILEGYGDGYLTVIRRPHHGRCHPNWYARVQSEVASRTREAPGLQDLEFRSQRGEDLNLIR